MKRKDLPDKVFIDYGKLRKTGLDQQQALGKLQIKTIPPSGLDNYNYLQETWNKNGMTVFKDFLKWYNNNIVPTLEAVEEMSQFYHNKRIDMLKLGSTFLKLANICLHNSTNYKFYPFCEKDKDLCEKIREDMTSGTSIMFIPKAVVDETFIRNSSNIYVNQLLELMQASFTLSERVTRCQQYCIRDGSLTLTCKNSRLDLIELATLRIWSCKSFYQETRPKCKLESFFTS